MPRYEDKMSLHYLATKDMRDAIVGGRIAMDVEYSGYTKRCQMRIPKASHNGELIDLRCNLPLGHNEVEHIAGNWGETVIEVIEPHSKELTRYFKSVHVFGFTPEGYPHYIELRSLPEHVYRQGAAQYNKEAAIASLEMLDTDSQPLQAN